jgi:hypothetical protein
VNHIHVDGAEGIETLGTVATSSGLFAVVDLHSGMIMAGLGLLAAFIGHVRYQVGMASAKVEREKARLRVESLVEWDRLHAPELEEKLEASERERRQLASELEWAKNNADSWRKLHEQNVASVAASRSLDNGSSAAFIDAGNDSGERERDERPASPGVGHNRVGGVAFDRPSRDGADLGEPGANP